MNYLVAIGAILAFLVWRGRVGRVLNGAEWRAAGAISSIGLIVAAAFVGLRGEVIPAVVLLAIGLFLLGTARWPRSRSALADRGGAMSLAEARATLGVEPGATEADVRAAHARLIRMAHPDAGGTTGLAAQLNAARDRLLKG